MKNSKTRSKTRKNHDFEAKINQKPYFRIIQHQIEEKRCANRQSDGVRQG